MNSGLIAMMILWLMGMLIISHLNSDIQSGKQFDLKGKKYVCSVIP